MALEAEEVMLRIPLSQRDPALFSRCVLTFKDSVDVRNRTYKLATYKNCFVASEAVGWIKAVFPSTRAEH